MSSISKARLPLPPHTTHSRSGDPSAGFHNHDTCRPDAVLNCVGLIKQLAGGNEVLAATPINTLLPHRLAELARARGGRRTAPRRTPMRHDRHGDGAAVAVTLRR